MQNNEVNDVYAGFFVRLAAYIFDWILVGACLLVIRIPLFISTFFGENILTMDFIFKYSVMDIVLYVLKALYFTLMTYYTGATLGKKVFHLKVVSADGEKLKFFDVLYRETVGKFLSGLILFVGYIMIGVDKEKRGFHDILSDTRVIYNHTVLKRVVTPIKVTTENVSYCQQPVQMVPVTKKENDFIKAPTEVDLDSKTWGEVVDEQYKNAKEVDENKLDK